MFKGFFRNKKNKVYFIIFVVTLTCMLLLLAFKNYFINIKDMIFSENSIMIVNSNEDYYTYLSKNKNVLQIERIALLSPNYNCDTIVKGNYVISKPTGEIIDSYLENLDEKKISWDLLEIIGFNHILVYNDSSLNDNEVILGIDSNFYDYYEEIISENIGEKVDFYFEKDELSLNIASIKNEKWPKVIVSENTFNNLIKHQKKYSYTIKLKSKDKSYDLKSEIKKLENNDENSVVLETSYQEDDAKYYEKVDKLLTSLNIALYIVMSVFLIVLFVVFKNIFMDMKKVNDIEKKIGYTKLLIKFIAFSKILLLYMLSFIVSLFLTFIIIFIIGLFIEFKFNYIYIENVILLFVFGIVIDLFTILPTKKY